MAATTDRWLRLESLFEQAVALPPAERRHFVEQHCAAEEDLRRRLMHMLESDDDDGVLDAGALPASGIRCVDAGTSLVGRRVGDFHVLRVIAAGGMGTVYEAQQAHPPRRVALKVLNGGLDSPDARRRFEFEAEALARLQHPCIAAVYESGVINDDAAARPYFAMELVEGLPLTRFAEERGLDLRQRVNLLMRVSEGIEHAHSRGVIHRDLKPANILVMDGAESSPGSTDRSPASGVNDSSCLPKILDFGIARAIGASERGRHTVAGQMFGTLAYMSPEQIAGDPGTIDVRCDVYALGVIAYELLGGRTPHDLTTASMAQAARIIVERDPPALGTLSRACRGDLEVIVRTALEREPDRRYPSAARLNADLQRFLRDEPIEARPASSLYRLRKFAQRNAIAVVAALTVLATLSLGVAMTTWQWRSAVVQRDDARIATERAQTAERRARQRLEETRHSVSEMLGFADNELAALPGGSQPREAIATAALDRLQRAAADASAAGDLDSSIITLLGYAHQRVGEAQLALGRSAEALAHHQRALEIRREQAAAFSHDVTYPRTVAVGHWKIAEPLQAMGRVREAAEHNREALSILQDVADRGGDTELNRLVYLAMAWRRVGESEFLAGRMREAIDAFERAHPLFDQALTLDPKHLPSLRTRASSLRVYGEALAAEGRDDAAIAAWRRALDELSPLQEQAGNANVFEMLAEARTRGLLARALAERGDFDAARDRVNEALRLASGLHHDDPASFDAAHLHAWCTMQAGEVARLTGHDMALAASKFSEALAECLRLADRDPDHARVRLDALRCCDSLRAMSPAAEADHWLETSRRLREHPGVQALVDAGHR